jgi:hypothetical protein
VLHKRRGINGDKLEYMHPIYNILFSNAFARLISPLTGRGIVGQQLLHLMGLCLKYTALLGTAMP